MVSKPKASPGRSPGIIQAIAALACLWFALSISAKLAITEVMSLATSTPGDEVNHSDYWELTNFGADTIDLAGFSFTDEDHPGKRYLLTPLGVPLLIRGGESIVFAKVSSLTADRAGFRAWWESCIQSDVQIVFYEGPGLSRYGDGLTVYEPAGSLIVDSVRFPAATRGVSFTYDPNTGAFGTGSKPGDPATCRSSFADIGSPGRTTGEVPLAIVRQPASTVVCRGLPTLFSVEAIGMPRPKTYQWLFNGRAIPGATQPSLVVYNASLELEGAYSVRISNGLSTTTSAEARLELDNTASAPIIVSPPQNATRAPARTARFTVAVCANPAPSIQWFTNGVPVQGATTETLLIPDCTLEMWGMTVRVRAENELGHNEAEARLFVSDELELRFTEVQANPKACEGNRDWIELTNFGTNEWQLTGYRISDDTRLADAFTITMPVSIRPKESIVFVRDASIGGFFEWWGARQLPRDLQVIPFTGFALNKKGDSLFLWSDTAEQDDEYVASASFLDNTAGFSVRLEADGTASDSVLGAFGAFRAAECGDVGSPGWAFSRPPLILAGIDYLEDRLRLSWGAEEGASYRIETRSSLELGQWTTLADVTARSFLGTFEDNRRPGREAYYRVRKVSP